jgi:DNA-binding CsgD family transcriptional regulator
MVEHGPFPGRGGDTPARLWTEMLRGQRREILRGRQRECAALDRLLGAVRRGQSRALLVRGEPGVGKTALLEYLLDQASGCRVARAAGVQSEMELPFAGLHQLCAPLLDRLGALPEPQSAALATAFGMSSGPAPDRFLVGLAVLSLFSDAAAEQPLVCVVDDAQWLDRESDRTLAFVARRLLAESVALVLTVRESAETAREWADLPELEVKGLSALDARALLRSAIEGPLDERVGDRIVAETRGNPLALLELPSGLTPEQLAGGFGLPDNAPALPARIEETFRRRLAGLPYDTRRLLLVAAAEPVGEPALVRRAADSLAIAVDAAAPAVAAGLMQLGARVRFRHPLVRSAVYRAASPEDRRRAHLALAEATDPEVDPDRRAWHRAHAAAGPDADVAHELERCAGRAQARGGLAAAAAFLERAAALTPEPDERVERALSAAQAKYRAGAPDAALELVAKAQAESLNELQRARVELLRARIAFAVNRGRDAPPLLLEAAARLEPLDPELARDTYLDALWASVFVGGLARGDGLRTVASAARAGACRQTSRAADLLREGLARLITEGHAAGAPHLRQAVDMFRGPSISREEELRWLWVACHCAMLIWDDDSLQALCSHQVRLAREAGALTALPIALTQLVGARLIAGDFAGVAALIEEIESVSLVTGSQAPAYLAVALAAFQGREAEAMELIDASMQGVMTRGEGIGVMVVQWATALLNNGLARYGEALAAAKQASAHPLVMGSAWSLPELIEGAARSGEPDVAADALRRLAGTTQPSGTDWALGIEARSRALLTDDVAAAPLYREAIRRLGRAQAPVDLARAHLLYGEWLSLRHHRLESREHLRTAYDMLTRMGVAAFAERAAEELRRVGEFVGRRTMECSRQLTSQECQIAQLAREGLTNAEIGARIMLSPRTVEYHLTKIYAKLDINSRGELEHVGTSLTAGGPAARGRG